MADARGYFAKYGIVPKSEPITNAASEGLNSRIQKIKSSARGYRNNAHFKTAIYFHCGGLGLYPLPTQFPDEPITKE